MTAVVQGVVLGVGLLVVVVAVIDLMLGGLSAHEDRPVSRDQNYAKGDR